MNALYHFQWAQSNKQIPLIMSEGRRTCTFQKFPKVNPRDYSGIPRFLANFQYFSTACKICKTWHKRKGAIVCLLVPLEPRKKKSLHGCACFCATMDSQARIMANQQCTNNGKGNAFRSRFFFCWQIPVILTQRAFKSFAGILLRVRVICHWSIALCTGIRYMLRRVLFFTRLVRGGLWAYIADTRLVRGILGACISETRRRSSF